MPGVDFSDVQSAARQIAGVAVRTPLLRSNTLDCATGASCWLKPEMLQVTGSFKFRGAYNRLSLLSAAQRQTGVVAYSSGNHAQGVAAAAQALGMPAVIIMPADAPALKIARTQAFGAHVVLYDRVRENREDIAARITLERNAVIVPPFNDAHVIAGQGTAGLEIAQDLQARGQVPDLFLVCCGGGGLASGCALALQAHFPDVDIIVVEPEHYDDVTRSLDRGAIVGIDGFAPTLCDALQTARTYDLPFDILRTAGARGVVVTEAMVRAAMRFAYAELKLVVEPGGAVALAALLAGLVDVRGKTVALTLSGGNVDPDVFAACLASDD